MDIRDVEIDQDEGLELLFGIGSSVLVLEGSLWVVAQITGNR